MVAVLQTTEVDEQQAPARDLGLTGLVLLAQFHGLAVDTQQIRHQFGEGERELTETELLLAAKSLGLKAKVARTAGDRLATTPLPALALNTWAPPTRYLLSSSPEAPIHCTPNSEALLEVTSTTSASM